MKIIDLLNKIANGEIPKTIVYDERYFTYDDKRQNYFAYDDSEIDWKYTVMEYINDEIEIIQENEILEEPKGIPEKLESYISCGWNGTCKDLKREELFEDLKKMGSKINEILDYLESKGE